MLLWLSGYSSWKQWNWTAVLLIEQGYGSYSCATIDYPGRTMIRRKDPSDMAEWRFEPATAWAGYQAVTCIVKRILPLICSRRHGLI